MIAYLCGDVCFGKFWDVSEMWINGNREERVTFNGLMVNFDR